MITVIYGVIGFTVIDPRARAGAPRGQEPARDQRRRHDPHQRRSGQRPRRCRPAARCSAPWPPTTSSSPRPAAGKGTCGVCRVKVLEGGGAILPTELGHITRGEAREGCRLSCQVKVKQDMKIEIPAEVFDVQQVEVQGALEPQRRHLHQGARSSSCPRARRCPSGPAATSRSSARRTRSHYKDFDIEEEYRDDWDKFDVWRYVSKVDETVDARLLDGELPGREGHHHAQRAHRLAAAAHARRAARATCPPTSSASSRATR